MGDTKERMAFFFLKKKKVLSSVMTKIHEKMSLSSQKAWRGEGESDDDDTF